MMRRAPGGARAAWSFRRLGSGSAPKPARRAATSIRLRATISARIPSAMGRLDEHLQASVGVARMQRVEGHANALAKVAGEARRHQQRARIERDDLGLGVEPVAEQERLEPLGILLRAAAAQDL